MTKDVQAKNASGNESPTPSQLWRERLHKSKQQPTKTAGPKNGMNIAKSGPAASTSPNNSNRKARKGFRAG